MSDFNAITQRLTLKSDLPSALQGFFHHVDSDVKSLLAEVFPATPDVVRFKAAHTGSSDTFPSWKGRQLLQQMGQQDYWSFSSSREDVQHLYLRYLTHLKPYLILTDGQIVLRQIFEYGAMEDVIYWDEKRQRFMQSFGHRFSLVTSGPAHALRHPMHVDNPTQAANWFWDYRHFPNRDHLSKRK